MRALAVGLTALIIAAPAAGGRTTARGKVAFLRGTNLVVLDITTGKETLVLRHAAAGPLHWSGDGKRLSDAGRVVGGPSFPSGEVKWAHSGERLAYVTKNGGVVAWSPRTGPRTVVPEGWGATSLAWSDDGRLALGRSMCHVPCGVPVHQEVWTWDGHLRRLVVGPLHGVQRPIVAGWTGDSHVLWWSDTQDSASIAADGLVLYADRIRIAGTLVYPDYVVRCGRHLALAAGGDRYATQGKRILLDGHDVSRDSTRSWVSPSCNADGSTLVAAAGRNWQEDRFGHEHRAMWQLLPARRQLTHPPSGWTDENPHLLADGAILFVRARQTSRSVNGTWFVTEHARLELLQAGKLTTAADVSYTASELTALGSWNYYGHYGWPWLIAVAP